MLQYATKIGVFQLAISLGKRRFFAALRMTFYVTLNEVKGLLYAISEKLVTKINYTISHSQMCIVAQASSLVFLCQPKRLGYIFA